MSCRVTAPWDCVTSVAGHAASSIAKDAFTSIADDFGKAAQATITWLWSQIGTATTVHLGGGGFALDVGIVAAIAAVVALGLFVIQLVTSVVRRDPGGLARAGRGLLVAFVGSAAAITVTNLLLSAVDAVSNGVVEAATGGSISQLGSRLLSATALTEAADPAGVLLLAVVAIVAVVIVWFAMTVRKLLIVVTAVFAPVAFAGSLADISASWVRRWIETTVALIVSKLILVLIFVVGLGILVDGAGQNPSTGAGGVTQALTQTAAGLLVLCLAGFAPWLALKLVHFSGDHFAHLHANAGAVQSMPAQAVAAPRKLQAQLSGLRHGSGGGPVPGHRKQPTNEGKAPPPSTAGATEGSGPAGGQGTGGGALVSGADAGAAPGTAAGGATAALAARHGGPTAAGTVLEATGATRASTSSSSSPLPTPSSAEAAPGPAPSGRPDGPQLP